MVVEFVGGEKDHSAILARVFLLYLDVHLLEIIIIKGKYIEKVEVLCLKQLYHTTFFALESYSFFLFSPSSSSYFFFASEVHAYILNLLVVDLRMMF